MPRKFVPLHLRRPRGRPRKLVADPAGPVVVESSPPVDLASINPAEILARLAADPAAVRASAARTLLRHQGASREKSALERLDERTRELMRRN